jgi:DNA-binding transcriptional LysR family regulator
MDLEETRAFLAVVDHGSFKSAAETLNQPRATLRRRVESLEARAGTTLLTRSRHGVALTRAGAVLAEHARTLVRETDSLLAALREVDDRAPRGRLRVGIASSLAVDEIVDLLGMLARAFPELRLDTHTVDAPLVDPFGSGFDPSDPADEPDGLDLGLVLVDEPAPALPRWTLVPLAAVREGLVASPAYLAAAGVPTTLDQLAEHRLLARRGDRDGHRWPLLSGGSVAIEPTILSGGASGVEQLRELARAGHGLALVHEPLVGAGAREDGLMPVLSELVGRRRTLAAAIPKALANTPKLQAIVAQLGRWRPQTEGSTWPDQTETRDRPRPARLVG